MVVEPYEHGLNRVFIKTKDERIRGTFLAHADTHVVSDCNVALLARQLALHAHVSTLAYSPAYTRFALPAGSGRLVSSSLALPTLNSHSPSAAGRAIRLVTLEYSACVVCCSWRRRSRSR